MKKILISLFLLIQILFINTASASQNCISISKPTEIVAKIAISDSVCFKLENINHSKNMKILAMKPAIAGHAYNIRVFDKKNVRRNTFSGMDLFSSFETSVNTTSNSVIIEINELEDYNDIKLVQFGYMLTSSGEPIIAIVYQNLDAVDDSGSGEVPLMAAPSSLMTTNSQTCDSSNTPPPYPSSFDLNKNLKWASTYLRAARIASPLGSYMLLKMLFDTGNRFDLKKDAGFSADFGNFFYGAALSQALYTTGEILGGAAAQQVLEDGGTYGEALAGFFSGIGDNPDDTPFILQGIEYADEVYDNDPLRDNVSDSCSRSPSGGNEILGGREPSIGNYGTLTCINWVTYIGTTADGTYCEGWAYF